ncbi:MAG: helix-hairpin-helix domain-containing protein, partial [Planctomycetota bacterium]
MVNSELVRAFERIGDLLEITGADRFRINSYRRAARTIKDSVEDLAVVAAEDRLSKLPGVGKSTAQKIKQYIDTRRIDLLDELSAKLPEGLPALLDVPGLGPKKVALLHSELSIGSMDELKQAVKTDALHKLPGFGATSVKRIAEGIAMLESVGGRTPLGIALPIARALADNLAGMEQVRRVEIAGSLRRGVETVGDVDLVCASEQGQAVVEAFVSQPLVTRILGSGPTKGSVTLDSPEGGELRVQLRVVPVESFGAALQYFTGSKEHNVRLRELAVKRR